MDDNDFSTDFETRPKQKTGVRNKTMSKGNFDIFSIDLRQPLESSAKGLLWWFVVIPLSVGAIWGVSQPGNLASVLGLVGRRVVVTTITETQPMGESLLNLTSGNGMRPGITADTVQDIRPGIQERPYQQEESSP